MINNKYIKWVQELGSGFCEDVFKFGELHQDIYKVTNVAKYRSFQYRLLAVWNCYQYTVKRMENSRI